MFKIENTNSLTDSSYPMTEQSLRVRGECNVVYFSFQLLCSDVEEERIFKSFNV